MATQITAAPQELDSAAHSKIDLKFLTLTQSIVDQYLAGAGAVNVQVSTSDLRELGIEGTQLLLKHCGAIVNTDFVLVPNAADGICLFSGGAPMPDAPADGEPASAGTPSTNGAASTESMPKKCPRPKNAFVIFRLDHHKSVKAQHPDLHNNDISKIIGGMWAAAGPAVKDEYKRKAEEEKRQHAITYPGYQYRPRKPSEKKKRMTKNKLAKLAAKSGGTNAINDAATLPAQPAEPVTSYASMPPYQNDTTQLAIHGGQAVVVPGRDGAGGLRDQLQLYNSQQPQQQPIAGSVPVLGVADSIPTIDLFSALDGVAIDGFWGPEVTFGSAAAAAPTTTSNEAGMQDPYAEQRRQEQLDEELAQLFDVSAFEAEQDVGAALGFEPSEGAF